MTHHSSPREFPQAPSQSNSSPGQKQANINFTCSRTSCNLNLSIGIHLYKASFTHSNIPEMCWHWHTCSSLLCLLTSSTTLEKNTTSPMMNTRAASSVWLLRINCHEWSCTNLFVNTFFQSFCLNAWKMEELSHRINVCWTLKNSQTIYTSGCSILHPHQIVAKFWLLIIPSHQLSRSQGFLTVIISVGYISHFPNDEQCQTHSHVFTNHLYIFLMKYLFKYSAYFFMFSKKNVVHLCFPCCFFPSITIKSQTIYKILIFFGLLKSGGSSHHIYGIWVSALREEQPHTAGEDGRVLNSRMDECLNADWLQLTEWPLSATNQGLWCIIFNSTKLIFISI